MAKESPSASKKHRAPRQQRFVEEYLIDLNASQAAIRAGYSPKTAGQQAFQLLQKPSIRARVDQALAERSKRTGINADRVLRELARLAFVDIADLIDPDTCEIHQAETDDTAAIQSLKVKVIPTESGDIVEREVRMADKIKALDLLGKHLGMFVDRREITGRDGGPIEVSGRVQNLSTEELQALIQKSEETPTAGEN